MEEKLIEFIAKLKRGTITILVSADIDFKNANEYTIAKNSAVTMESIHKKIAFSKFKQFFVNKLKECQNNKSFFIKIIHEIENVNNLYFVRFYNGGYFDDLNYHEDGYETKTTGLFEIFNSKEIAINQCIEEEVVDGKIHIVDSKDAKLTLIGIVLAEIGFFAIFRFPYRITVLATLVAAVFALIGMISIAYHWLYKHDYYM